MYKKIIFIFLFLVIFFCLGIYLLYTDKINTPLTSPLLKEGKTVSAVNQWFPKVLGLSAIGGPEITARAAFFIDSVNGEILFAKNQQQRLPVASLAKVMTVLIALENKGLEDKFLVSHRAAEYEPDKMNLAGGEVLTLQELLYGIFLVSANDAAEVIAENTTGSREEFISLMNQKAAELGMKDTRFVNPTGLDEDTGSSYSTAYDLSLLTRYLIKKYPDVVKISSSTYIYFEPTLEHQAYEMYSGINLLTTYPGVIGFKTGFTPEAGFTIITLAQKNNKEVIGVLLNSENRRDETKQLLDYSFEKLVI